MIPEKKKPFFTRKLLLVFLKLSIMLSIMSIIFMWTNKPALKTPREERRDSSSGQFFLQDPNKPNNDEQRIARHFVLDTLPGLIHLGLIRKYERFETGTLLQVTGKIWKARSRFFQDSLLTEVLVYNKVNGYSLETQVVDYTSQRLYARALSVDRKEYFD